MTSRRSAKSLDRWDITSTICIFSANIHSESLAYKARPAPVKRTKPVDTMVAKEPAVPTAVENNVRTVREHYDALFDLVDRENSYVLSAFTERPPIVNMGYWLNDAKTAREAQEQLVHELARRVGDWKGKRVIDVGCGLAGPAALLAREYGAEVDGVNIVERQVKWARRYINGNAISDRVRVHLASAMDLPFPDETFDIVFCLEAAHCFIDKRRFLSEVRRVLRDGGKLLLADIVGTVHLPLLNWQPTLKLNLVTASDWKDMITAAGFAIDDIEMIGKAVYPGCRWWAKQTAAQKRRAIFLKSCDADASPFVKRLMMMRAWVLERVYFRSVLLILSRFRLREFAILSAVKRG